MVSQVLAAALAAIAQMIANVEEVAADLFATGDNPGAARDAYTRTVRALSAHQGEGNRVVIAFPTDTIGGNRFGHQLATAVLDGASESIELPDSARITDHNGMSILAW
jgi:hypothetical protein